MKKKQTENVFDPISSTLGVFPFGSVNVTRSGELIDDLTAESNDTDDLLSQQQLSALSITATGVDTVISPVSSPADVSHSDELELVDDLTAETDDFLSNEQLSTLPISAPAPDPVVSPVAGPAITEAIPETNIGAATAVVFPASDPQLNAVVRRRRDASGYWVPSSHESHDEEFYNVPETSSHDSAEDLWVNNTSN